MINRSVADMAERDRVLAEAEHDIADLVEAASHGDFGRRLVVADRAAPWAGCATGSMP